MSRAKRKQRKTVFQPEFKEDLTYWRDTNRKVADRALRIVDEIINRDPFTGIGKPRIPATISITFTVLRIPMALVLVKYLGINGIWWSIALSSVLKGVSAYMIYRLKVWKV